MVIGTRLEHERSAANMALYAAAPGPSDGSLLRAECKLWVKLWAGRWWWSRAVVVSSSQSPCSPTKITPSTASSPPGPWLQHSASRIDGYTSTP